MSGKCVNKDLPPVKYMLSARRLRLPRFNMMHLVISFISETAYLKVFK